MLFGWPLALLQYWRQIALVGAVLLVLGYHWNAVRTAHKAGRAEALAEIATANEAARKKADDAISAPDFTNCPLNKWNRETGRCEP